MSALNVQDWLDGLGEPERGAEPRPGPPPGPGPAPSSGEPSPRRSRWPAAAQAGSLAACAALWWSSVSWVRVGTLGQYGLLPAFPVAFFAALGLLVASFVAALRSRRPSQAVLAGHVVALVVFLHGTAPLVFPVPSYPWVYTHFGVVQYIDLHGRLDSSVDIYQNWPAFFAVSAWFTRVAGMRGPLEFAAWAQVFFNLCNAVLLRYVFGALSRDIRTIWLAIFVFFAANWVAQDYFAPQAFAFTLSLGLCGVILRWLMVATDKAFMARWLSRFAAFVVRLGRRRRVAANPDEPTGSQRFGRRAARNIALLVFAVIVASHQLTPYMLIAGLTVLTVLGVVRPRLLVAGFLVIAVAYLLPRLEFVQVNYGLLTGAGNPLHNSRNATIGFDQGDPGRIFSAQASRLLSLMVWGLGFLGIIRRLRAGYKNLGVMVLAAAPVLIIFGESYGGEVIYRIYLFSLPWLALLCAFGLQPGRRGWASRMSLPRVALPLLGLLALFIPSYFGLAEVNQVRPGEVAASEHFYRNAPRQSLIMLASPQFPVRLAPNYEQFQLAIGESDPNLLVVEPSLRGRMLGAGQVPVIAKVLRDYGGGRPAFLVVSRNGKVYSDVFDLLPAGSLDRLEDALERSSRFRVWFRNDDTTIFELVPSRTAGDRGRGAGR
jgi:hypothetical protein